MRRAFLSQLPIVLLVLIAVEASSSSARAERWAKTPDGDWHAVQEQREPPPVFAPDTKVRLFGVTLLGGIPDGIAPSISIHPGTNLLHFDVGISSLLSFGVRVGATFDPFDWVLAPTLTVAGGYNAWAKIPSTETQYQLYYLNIQPGLELGRRSRFRVFVRAGYSRLWAGGRTTSKLQGLQATSQPSVRVGLFPTLNVGLTGYFGE